MPSRRWGLAALALVVGGLVGLVGLRVALYGGEPSGDSVVFRVEEGSSLSRVARRLDDAGLLSGAWRLRAVARLEGGAKDIHAGDYQIRAGTSPADILEILVSGRVVTIPVTLVEGWTVEQSADALVAALQFDRDALLAILTDPPTAWRASLEIPDGHGLEGYLLPETYRFAGGTAPERVVNEIVGSLERALVDSVRARMAEVGMSLHEVLTLASIVEAEAVRDDERTSIAAVYHNRLRKGWKLEADPTVAYALGKQGERLIFRDLEVDSPYNTYRVKGLPPGPINSPGWASILATLWPREDFDAMYFVADGSGGHAFSRTWEEHSAAVREYRKLQRQRRAREAG